MNDRRIGVLAGIVSVVGLVVNYVPSVVLNRWFHGGFDGAVPMVGTAGQTVVVYGHVVNSAASLVTLSLAIGLGYYAGRRLDVAAEYRRFGRIVAVGSLLSIAGIWVVLIGVRSTSMDAIGVLMNLAVLLRMAVTVSLPVTVGAFAGAALAHFRTNEKTPISPTDADAGDPSTVAEKSATDNSDARSSES